jgi:hypothetical protein
MPDNGSWERLPAAMGLPSNARTDEEALIVKTEPLDSAIYLDGEVVGPKGWFRNYRIM